MHCEQPNLLGCKSTAADQELDCARPMQPLGQCIRVSFYYCMGAGSQWFQDVGGVGPFLETKSESVVVMYFAWLFRGKQ